VPAPCAVVLWFRRRSLGSGFSTQMGLGSTCAPQLFLKSGFLTGGHVYLPLWEGQAVMPTPRKPVSAENQASEGRVIKPASHRRVGSPSRPFSSSREGGSAFINAPGQWEGGNSQTSHLPRKVFVSLCDSKI
jgi:hypothetical protein